MDRSVKKDICLRLAKIFHILVLAALFGLCLAYFYAERIDEAHKLAFVLTGGAAYFILFDLLGRIYDVYAVGTYRVSRLLYSQILTLFLSVGCAYFVLCVAFLSFINPVPIILLFVLQSVWSIIWTLIANRIYFKMIPPHKTLVIYDNDAELYKLDEIKNSKMKFELVKYVKISENTASISGELLGMDVVFIVGVESEIRNLLAKECIAKNIQCYIMPRVGDVIIAGADRIHNFSVPFMMIQHAAPNIEYLFIKRTFDIIVSLIGIILLSPFMLITALAIKIYDGGPVLYKQVRLTKNYKKFNVLKFRSMRTDAEKDGVARLSSANDDRITPVGKLIRKIRFDELPQLFNILRGDMTIVGPRPERPEIAEQYEKEIPSFGLRLQVKAGLTGYAQVYGKYNTEPYDKLKMDLMYINKMSVSEDIKLMFATVKILFLPESTEGVAEGQTTASSQSQNVTETQKEKEIQKV